MTPRCDPSRRSSIAPPTPPSRSCATASIAQWAPTTSAPESFPSPIFRLTSPFFDVGGGYRRGCRPRLPPAPTRSGRGRGPVNGNSLQLCPQLALSAPEVIRLLHPQPKCRAVAAEPSQSSRHLGRDGCLLGHNPMKCLARHTELAGRLTDRKAERRKDILTQDSARMRRSPRQPVGNFRLVLHCFIPVTLDVTPVKAAVT